MYLDGGTLRTLIDVNGEPVESGRQDLLPAVDFESPEGDWCVEGSNGRSSDIHADGKHARVDGITYLLISRND
jgi:hypothetical protein